MAGTVTIQGMSSSEPAGQRVIGPLSVQGIIVIGETLSVPLVTGDNTFAIPSSAVGVVIVPPSTGTPAMTLRYSTNSGDTGLPLSTMNPSMQTFPTSTPASLIINSASGLSSPISLFFW